MADAGTMGLMPWAEADGAPIDIDKLSITFSAKKPASGPLALRIHLFIELSHGPGLLISRADTRICA